MASMLWPCRNILGYLPVFNSHNQITGLNFKVVPLFLLVKWLWSLGCDLLLWAEMQ